MLKALELVGFKSFADRTRFEFSSGITCVVGPNGSGKSNVVDGIKWVLGEQSVKSLRGKEMADVIFNGSATRPPMNAAEATLTFDNGAKKLPVEAADVAITRRVYRSGESEYLINKQPCRLRDIRDLFSGTGAATDAYSVIEQGKVDVLLQSSPKERRSVFEEAAGISRFKARKLESQRRLERVDQNLLRLHDIVEEVENRLKSVRNQAAKAKRYQEHVDRLQQLRTHTARVDWRKLSERLQQQEAALAQTIGERDALAQILDRAETRLLEIDVQLGDAAESLRKVEAQASQAQQRIASCESTIRHERERTQELEDEAGRRRRLLIQLNSKVGAQLVQVEETLATLGDAEKRHGELVQLREAAERDRAALEAARRQDELRVEALRRSAREHAQAASAADNEAASLEARLTLHRDECRRRDERRDEISRRLQALDAERSLELQNLTKIEGESAAAGEACAAARDEMTRLRREADDAAKQLSDLRRRQAALAERWHLLEDLQRRQEGLHAGVKQILALRGRDEAGPLKEVAGLAADLVRSPLDIAPAVDAALADRAQFVVPRRGAIPAEIAEFAISRIEGRVGFLFLDGLPAAERPGPEHSPAGRVGVVGRLDLLVDCELDHRPLIRTLLSATWLVDSLARGLELRGEFPQLDFATRQGELVTAEGELTVGRRASGGGLVSRRSELADLREQIAAVDDQLASSAAAAERAEGNVVAQEVELRRLDELERRHMQEAAAQRGRVEVLNTRREQLAAQATAIDGEAARAESEAANVAARLDDVAGRRAEAAALAAAAETEIAQLQAALEKFVDRRRELDERLTAAKVEQAKGEERLNHLRAERIRHEQDRVERRRALDECRAAIADNERRRRASEFQILRAEGEAAFAYLDKERLTREQALVAAESERLRGDRQALAAESQSERQRLRELQEALHALELSVETIRLERGNLADRIRDDYGLELSSLEAEGSAEEQQQREEIERQIADLRRKINNIGNVNLEALEELDELEARYKTLSDQFNDLDSAKKSLETIIARIDADSRRLFQETLETVRGHFQILFRKLFGGGQADVVLEEGVDILEAGIEIMARPPGKETRNISLLSGGEKTLTCVALLLAVFQYRPSPFCVLDEVDAALDEANIGRFVSVLHEFLTWTQFIIVTHSKKTMTCASTLYGVTMQESGVSKRVAVRFEDVRDNGEIVTRGDVDAAGEQADTDAA